MLEQLEQFALQVLTCIKEWEGYVCGRGRVRVRVRVCLKRVKVGAGVVSKVELYVPTDIPD